MRVVAVGGGTGLSVLLRGLKRTDCDITAVVTVGDDGGSSGRIRRELGLLPPGDFRSCVAALASDEDLMAQVLQYRFGDGSLEGHALGNLVLAAMAALCGSFEGGVGELGRILNIRGRILPSTLEPVTVCAEASVALEGTGVRRVRGESKVGEAGPGIRRVFLEPEAPPAYPPAVSALLSADLIVLGPGSLYTSILPNLLVPRVQEAIRASKALKVYVCNVAVQSGETDGLTVEGHAAAIEANAGIGLFHYVLANNHWPRGPAAQAVQFVPREQEWSGRFAIIESNLVDAANPWRHDSGKLCAALLNLVS